MRVSRCPCKAVRYAIDIGKEAFVLWTVTPLPISRLVQFKESKPPASKLRELALQTYLPKVAVGRVRDVTPSFSLPQLKPYADSRACASVT